MTRTGRVAVLNGPEELEIRELPLPRIRDGELLVRILACTICGSDLHTFTGRRSMPAPCTLGHECVGQVVEGSVLQDGQIVDGPVAGPRCQITVGDRITWSIVVGCNFQTRACEPCGRGLPQKCRNLFKYGHKTFAAFPFSGGLADYCVLVPGTEVLRVPRDMPDEVACLANCSAATAEAALRTAGDIKSVLVQGAGALGLMVAAFTRHHNEVIVCDPSPTRRAMARRCGATHTTPPAKLGKAVEFVTQGQGVQAAIDCAGTQAAFWSGLQSLTVGGRYVLLGSVWPAGAAQLPMHLVVSRMLSIHGVHNYRFPDLRTALRLLSTATYPFAELVGVTYKLDDVDAAFRHALTGECIRVMVKP